MSPALAGGFSTTEPPGKPANFIDLSPLSFFLMSLAKGLSILCIFSKDKLLLSFTFSVIFFVSISFIPVLMFIISSTNFGFCLFSLVAFRYKVTLL